MGDGPGRDMDDREPFMEGGVDGTADSHQGISGKLAVTPGIVPGGGTDQGHTSLLKEVLVLTVPRRVPGRRHAGAQMNTDKPDVPRHQRSPFVRQGEAARFDPGDCDCGHGARTIALTVSRLLAAWSDRFPFHCFPRFGPEVGPAIPNIHQTWVRVKSAIQVLGPRSLRVVLGCDGGSAGARRRPWLASGRTCRRPISSPPPTPGRPSSWLSILADFEECALRNGRVGRNKNDTGFVACTLYLQ